MAKRKREKGDKFLWYPGDIRVVEEPTTTNVAVADAPWEDIDFDPDDDYMPTPPDVLLVLGFDPDELFGDEDTGPSKG